MDVDPAEPPAVRKPTLLDYTLLTSPPIPWPQPSLGAESLQVGGRYWPTSAAEAQNVSTARARAEYIQALYLPEQVYPLADLVHTLVDVPVELLASVQAVSAKHRRVLPALLPSLFSSNPPHAVLSPPAQGEQNIDDAEWRTLRSGFGLRLGSKGLGVPAKGKDGETEEERSERRTAEEERWVCDGREWVESLERREVLMQVLVHFLLPPPASAQSTSLPKKRSRKSTKAAPASPSDGTVNLAQSLTTFADRLSLWQSLSTLGVDSLSLTTPKGKERATSSGDWVQRFYLDIIEPNFAKSHPGFCLILTSALQLPTRPRPVKATPSRTQSAPAEVEKSNPTPPTPVVWPPVPAPSAASRRKGKARQLPEDANKYVLAAAAAAGKAGGGSTAGARMADSISRAASTSRPFSRSSSSASNATGAIASERSRSATTAMLERAASVGPAASIKPLRAASLGPSAAAGAANGSASTVLSAHSTSGRSSSSFARTASQGPESQAEKLMRRSVSFTKGAGVGKKPAGGGAGVNDKEKDGRSEQMKLDGLWGARINKPLAASGGMGEEKGVRAAAGRRDSLAKTKSTGARIIPASLAAPATVAPTRTLVPETPVKAVSRTLVLGTPVGALPAFVAETPPAADKAGGRAAVALGRVMEGDKDGLDEFFDSDGE